jgi:plasmid stabilization system protein ParE
MKPVRFHADARFEFRQARLYYDSKQPGLGRRFVEAVENTARSFAHSPQLFRLVYEDIRKSRVPRFPYALLCREREDHIEIVAVMHLHRDPDYWKSRI